MEAGSVQCKSSQTKTTGLEAGLETPQRFVDDGELSLEAFTF